jgi:hypothetical protein
MATKHAPRLRLICCLCGKPVAQSGDAYILDGEWARRYPSMRGRIACRCAIGCEWQCKDRSGQFVAGHIPTPPGRSDFDSWSHILESATHKAAALLDLKSAMMQGGEDYIRWVAHRRGVAPAQKQRLTGFLASWDAR